VSGIPGVSSLCLISSKREKTQFYSNHTDLSRRERGTRNTFTEGGGHRETRRKRKGEGEREKEKRRRRKGEGERYRLRRI
jgi:hypothetical protein